MNEDSPTWRADVITKLARIETKVDALIEARKDQETRLRYLEKRNAIMIGACAVISFAVSCAARKLGF